MRESDDDDQLQGGPFPTRYHSHGRALVCGVSLKAASQNKLTNSILRNPVYGGCSKTNDQFVLASLQRTSLPRGRAPIWVFRVSASRTSSPSMPRRLVTSSELPSRSWPG